MKKIFSYSISANQKKFDLECILPVSELNVEIKKKLKANKFNYRKKCIRNIEKY